jgi:hypothetical protein
MPKAKGVEHSPLRRVSDEQAGPDALGILLPPGTRTVLIVRPRALRWDLLLVQGVASTTFRELTRHEAAATAQAFYAALEEWNRGKGPGHIGAVASSCAGGGAGAGAGAAGGFLVWADIGDFALVACERVPGQPYRPAVFAAEEAQRAVALLGVVLRPTAPAQQEVYFNTRHFVR